MTENNRDFQLNGKNNRVFYFAFHIMVKIGQENTKLQWAFVEFIKKSKSIRNRILLVVSDGKLKREKVSDMLDRAKVDLK
jgi:hypothetical protein